MTVCWLCSSKGYQERKRPGVLVTEPGRWIRVGWIGSGLLSKADYLVADLDLVYHVHSFDHFAEDAVIAIQAVVIHGINEPLAGGGVAVRRGERHGDASPLVRLLVILKRN